MRKTPHRIGNDGEAPMDYPPSMDRRLINLASDLDAAVSSNNAGTAYSVDQDEVRRIIACLEEIADEVFEYMKDHGVVL